MGLYWLSVKTCSLKAQEVFSKILYTQPIHISTVLVVYDLLTVSQH